VKRIIIRTVDADVVVLAVTFFDKLSLEMLWIYFGVGRHTRFIPNHDLVTALGPQKCQSLSFFHALTGCDTVSCFSGKGKKSAWQAWGAFPDVTTAFLEISNYGHDDDITETARLLLGLQLFYLIRQVSCVT
jgi:hypothetical protein